MIILPDYFYYDETSFTCLRWKIDRCSGPRYVRTLMMAVDIAGSWRGILSPYFIVQLYRKNYFCHRIIYELFYGKIPEKMQVDHWDRDRTHNTIWNLRLADNDLNRRNVSKQKRNKSGVTGVYLNYTKIGTPFWQVQWYEYLTGEAKSKCFNVLTLGNKNAFDLACNYRAAMIEEQNKLGAGYTESHGK